MNFRKLRTKGSNFQAFIDSLVISLNRKPQPTKNVYLYLHIFTHNCDPEEIVAVVIRHIGENGSI